MWQYSYKEYYCRKCNICYKPPRKKKFFRFKELQNLGNHFQYGGRYLMPQNCIYSYTETPVAYSMHGGAFRILLWCEQRRPLPLDSNWSLQVQRTCKSARPRLLPSCKSRRTAEFYSYGIQMRDTCTDFFTEYVYTNHQYDDLQNLHEIGCFNINYDYFSLLIDRFT